VFDQQYRYRYIFAGLQPGQRIPRKWLESGVIVQADTLADLAPKAGLPADELSSTVERFNGFARSGVDEGFHRGESAYDRHYGDPTNKPNPNLGEISHGPYYATKLVPGDLGPRAGSAPTCTAARCMTTGRRSRDRTRRATSVHR
jgi:3-oxosteroid 1-dehydrogenase